MIQWFTDGKMLPKRYAWEIVIGAHDQFVKRTVQSLWTSKKGLLTLLVMFTVRIFLANLLFWNRWLLVGQFYDVLHLFSLTGPPTEKLYLLMNGDLVDLGLLKSFCLHSRTNASHLIMDVWWPSINASSSQGCIPNTCLSIVVITKQKTWIGRMGLKEKPNTNTVNRRIRCDPFRPSPWYRCWSNYYSSLHTSLRLVSSMCHESFQLSWNVSISTTGNACKPHETAKC